MPSFRGLQELGRGGEISEVAQHHEDRHTAVLDCPGVEGCWFPGRLSGGRVSWAGRASGGAAVGGWTGPCRSELWGQALGMLEGSVRLGLRHGHCRVGTGCDPASQVPRPGPAWGSSSVSLLHQGAEPLSPRQEPQGCSVWTLQTLIPFGRCFGILGRNLYSSRLPAQLRPMH